MPEPAQARCLHHLFEEQAARTPDAVAVAGETVQITYGGLNRRANQLAWCLRTAGVGPEVRVATCLPYAAERVVALLGILKAGGNVVEIDPACPAAELATLLCESRVAALVSLEAQAIALTLPGVALLLLDRDAPTLAMSPSEPVVCNVRQEHLAHTRFLPRLMERSPGVGVDHAAAVAAALAQQEEQGLQPGDRVLHGAPLTVADIASVLGAGATLVLPTGALANGPAAFRQACAAWQVTVINLPVGAWQQVAGGLDHGATALPIAVRLVLLSSEGLQPSTVRRGPQGINDQVSFVALHGLIEASGSVVACPVPEGPAGPERLLGRALPHAQLYVLNHSLHPVPPGDPGELYIGGSGIARCYIDRPVLTAARFLPHPFAPDPGLRLLQTGARVRRLPDRSLAYLGPMAIQDEEDAELGPRRQPQSLPGSRPGMPAPCRARLSKRLCVPSGVRCSGVSQ